MNTLIITGGTKFDKEVATKVIGFCLKKLLPKTRTLEIEVRIKKFKEADAVGYCLMGDSNKEFEIEVAKGQTLKEFVTTLTHEMVHVKQYYRKEMKDTKTPDGHYLWKKNIIDGETLYKDLPWEIEAYDLQDKLATEIWERNVL